MRSLGNAGRWTAWMLACALVVLVAGCSRSKPSLSDFPPYPPAQRYLALQARWRAYHPTPPPQYHFDARGQVIFDHINTTTARYRDEKAAEARERARYEVAARRASHQLWAQFQARISRGEVTQTRRAQERGEAGVGARLASAARFRAYSERVARAARRNELNARERIRYERLDRERIQRRLAELRRRQLVALEQVKKQVPAAAP